MAYKKLICVLVILFLLAHNSVASNATLFFLNLLMMF